MYSRGDNNFRFTVTYIFKAVTLINLFNQSCKALVHIKHETRSFSIKAINRNFTHLENCNLQIIQKWKVTEGEKEKLL
jgi:hypothetical protein